MLKIVFGVFCIGVVFVLYCCLIVGKRADEAMSKIMEKKRTNKERVENEKIRSDHTGF